MSIRQRYQELGVDKFYQDFGSQYRNPHELCLKPLIQEVFSQERNSEDPNPILDLACGSGEISIALMELGYNNIKATDPYTADNYFQRTGLKAEEYSFEDIAEGALSDRRYSLVICSYALYLCSPSVLPNCCWQLSLICPKLVVLTPHKNPKIESSFGFDLIKERARVYESRSYQII